VRDNLVKVIMKGLAVIFLVILLKHGSTQLFNKDELSVQNLNQGIN